MQLFLFGTFWFWALIVVSLIITVRLVETFDPHEVWAGFTILITLVLLAIFGNWEFFKNILIFIQDNPLIIVGYVLIYIIIGIGWSFFKWYAYLRKKRDYYREHNFKDPKIPGFKENVSRIVSWMMYWPFSALWTLTHNLFRDVFNFLTEQLRGAYEKVTKNVFKEFEKKEEE